MTPSTEAQMIALAHEPSPLISQCEQTFVPKSPIDYSLALDQHRDYCKMLADCGCNVKLLSANREFSDSTFIEDTAVVLNEVAVLASMGVESRRSEPAGIEPELRQFREVKHIRPPATLEGGDVLQVGRRILVGLSRRTNMAGVLELAAAVECFGYVVKPIRLQGCLHLKTACTALSEGELLVNPAWVEVEDLGDFRLIRVPEEEPWAANICLIGTQVCISKGHFGTEELLQARGFDIRSVEISEFAKAEGGVTCLSLIFEAGT